jgi:hypothetical protein
VRAVCNRVHRCRKLLSAMALEWCDWASFEPLGSLDGIEHPTRLHAAMVEPLVIDPRPWRAGNWSDSAGRSVGATADGTHGRMFRAS